LNHTKIDPSEQPERYWLQSLQHAGADLVEYGRLEKCILKDPNPRSRIEIYSKMSVGGIHFPGASISNLTYEPEPEDWHIWFSWPLDECAGEFWHMVENPELFNIPGAWLSE
jgi:hypothetical protein